MINLTSLKKGLKVFGRSQRYIVGLLLLLGVIIHAQATNLYIKGVLIDDPCSMIPNDGNMYVDFGDITDKDLYNSRRIEAPFYIELTECSSSAIKTLTVKFSGKESTKQPGLLALDSSSLASGIAIGIENNGIALPINGQQGATFPFQNGNSSLPFTAYVQADPDVLAQKNVGLGPFTATATFVFEYN